MISDGNIDKTMAKTPKAKSKPFLRVLHKIPPPGEFMSFFENGQMFTVQYVCTLIRIAKRRDANDYVFRIVIKEMGDWGNIQIYVSLEDWNFR